MNKRFAALIFVIATAVAGFFAREAGIALPKQSLEEVDCSTSSSSTGE